MKIRKAYPTDAYTLIKIHDTVWKTQYYDILPVGVFHRLEQEQEKRINHLKNQIEENNRIFVAVNENEQVIKPFSSNKIIAYNCTKPLEHKKFIVGHELSHYIEEKHKNPDKKIVCAARDHYSKDYSNNRDEQRKDYISAAMLMPQSIMKSKYQNIEPKNTDAFYQQVADEFKVSKVMAIRRIEELFSVE